MNRIASSITELPDPGVSDHLARERASAIRDLRYEVSFSIPALPTGSIEGSVTLRFRLEHARPIVLDFTHPQEHVRTVRVAGHETPFLTHADHIIVGAPAFAAGENEIAIDFVADDAPLNRHEEFLYTLFVPARAHSVFPCFDQPDLKARFTLTLDLPPEWESVATGAAVDAGGNPERRRVTFGQSPPLPTYVFGFAAGRFTIETAARDGRRLRMFHREADAAKVTSNRDAIFDLHARALQWLENYTTVPYPFSKFDFVLIPSFQFAGMEHPGAILYNASDLLLDDSATQNHLLHRASLIAHETSHMWFGDLVTMKWFDDVWLKEVFANFMAAKIVNPSFPDLNHDLRFFLAHYPDAYDVDRTAGANPIRQPLGNLNEAGQLYGPIIYKKAPIVMRQLETLIGEDVFRDGVRKYLGNYPFGNAAWPDLISTLQEEAPYDLERWSRCWIEERGRPQFTTSCTFGGDGTISELTVEARDPWQRGLVWPQRLLITLGYPTTATNLPVSVSEALTRVDAARGMPAPAYVLPGGGGLGYGLFLLDDASRAYLLDHLPDIPDALTRGAAWATLWDNLIEARVSAGAFIDLALAALETESDEQLGQRVLEYLARAYWRFLSPDVRLVRATVVEEALRRRIESTETSSMKAACFAAFRDMVLTVDGLAWLENVWSREVRIDGLPFAEADEIRMAFEMAVRDVPGADAIMQMQLERTVDTDRKTRMAFVMPALSSDDSVRERAFARFRSVEHRRREPWVLESLRYVHHPLRQSHATQLIRPGLDLLLEIQSTGDIFFPSRWLDAALAGHHSAEAAAVVTDFLAQPVDYPRRLRWAILVAADHLLRYLR